MRINKSARMKFVLEEIWIQGNLISKLSRNLKLKSRDARARQIRPDGRTRGGHAQKRAARDKNMAAETRQKPHFHGNVDEAAYQISWLSFIGTLLPPTPINTPAGEQRGASRDEEIRFSLAFSLNFCNCNFFLSTLWRRRSFVFGGYFRIKVTSLPFKLLSFNLVFLCDLSLVLFFFLFAILLIKQHKKKDKSKR